MSVWGPGPIENDDAADWVSELEEEPSLMALQEPISEVADPAHVGELYITDCCEAVAAAELLTQLLGKPATEPILDNEAYSVLSDLIEGQAPSTIKKYLTQAMTAVRRVLNDEENSELWQYWEESQSGPSAWETTMLDLLNRLQELSENQK
jgi:hypothetical protein